MILYKYVGLDGIDIVKNLRIKLSSPSSFNDPFELAPGKTDITEAQIEKFVLNNEQYMQHIHALAVKERRTDKPYVLFRDEQKEEPKKTKFITNALRLLNQSKEADMSEVDRIALMSCFCGEAIEKNSEILMWAHYAQKNKGLRLAFNAELLSSKAAPIMKMKYLEKRLCLNPIDYWQNGEGAFSDLYTQILTMKSIVWEYENEYRWLVSLGLCQKEGENTFISICADSIVGVDCGWRCSADEVDFIRETVRNKLGSHMPVRQAVLDEYEFKFKYV